MTDRADLRLVKEAANEAAEAAEGGPGLDLPDDLLTEDWLALGRRLAARRGRDNWALGDWACHGDRRYGDLTEAAGEIGIAYKTLRNLAHVARKLQMSRRRDNLSWSHHGAVADIDPAEADRLLDRAEAEGWSRERMREEARAASREGQLAAENARLRRELERAIADRDTARAALRATEAQTKDAIGGIVRGWSEIDQATEAFFHAENPVGAAGLHGTAKTKAATRLRRRLVAGVEKINEIVAAIDDRLVAAGAADIEDAR